jgi:CheY-specific phosphatase CheX
MSYLRVLTLTDLLSADVVDEFGCRLYANLSLNLSNKGFSIDLSLIKLLVHIIKCPVCTISKLS